MKQYGKSRPATAVISKTKMLAFVKSFDWKAIRSALAQNADVLGYRGPRGENYLHVCCGVDIRKHRLSALDSIKTADLLIDSGLDVNGEAFREGEWKATPLWFVIARSNNPQLAKHLLKRGASPEYCLWAAAYNDDSAAIRLLAAAGATIDPAGGETPLLFAVRWSRFAAARTLLQCGADPNSRGEASKTALHYMLKKRSDPRNVRMFLEHGARLDSSDRDGITVRSLLSRSRDARYRALLENT